MNRASFLRWASGCSLLLLIGVAAERRFAPGSGTATPPESGHSPRDPATVGITAPGPGDGSGPSEDGSAAVGQSSDADRQAWRRIEAALHGGDSAAAEAALRQDLPDLLEKEGAAFVQRLLAAAEPGAVRETSLRVCAILWPKLDPDAALVWAAQLPDAPERAEARTRIISSLAEFAPEEAMKAAMTENETAQGDILIANVAQAWARLDPAAARKWTLNLPPGARRDGCVARIAMAEAQSFPGDAARFALLRLPDGPVLDETILAIVHRWAGRNAGAARRWAESFPAGPLRERALREVDDFSTTSNKAADDDPPPLL